MKSAAVITLFLLFTSSLPGQCPGRDFLWHRIIFLRDSSQVSTGDQLKELTIYENKMGQCTYRNDSTHALLLQRIGWLYTTKNDFFNAIQYTRKCITLIDQQKNNPAINPALALKCFWNLHLMYDSLKLETKNIAALDSCISRAISLNNYDYQRGALLLIVPRLFSAGDYFRCVRYATLGETVINKISATPAEAAENSIQYFLWKVNALIYLKKTDEAAGLVAEKIRFAKKNSTTNQLGALYGLYATVLFEKGKYTAAISYFKKCFLYNKSNDYKTGCAEALNNIGYAYSKGLRQNKTAVAYHFKALEYSDKYESLNILGNIANIYVHAGNYDSAFFYFQKAFNQLAPGFTEAGLLKNDNAELPGITEYITGVVLDKAAACLSKYKATGQQSALQQAILIYEVMDGYFDKLKSAQSEIQSKLFWKTNNRRLYEQAIEACYESGNKEKAFYFFEKSRSVLLNDEIMEQRRMDDKTLAKQAQLKKNILDIERTLQSTGISSKESLALQQQMIINKQELGMLANNTRNQFPSRDQDYSRAASLTLEVARNKILKGSKSMIEIFAGDSAVYLLSVTVNNASFIKLNKQLYDSLTSSYISFIALLGRLNKDFSGFVNVSHQLYELIFHNIKIQDSGSLIISPDGKSFPFEALVTNANSKVPDYLLSRYATSYTYSARYLVNEYVPVNAKKSNSVLGMAPVNYKQSLSLSELPGSDNSLENINNYFSGATNYVQEKATRNNFQQHFPDYSIIQLYTHAAESSSNNDPVIYFADSALYLSDLILDRKPVTQLVVLSACETANGKLYEGEGIFSFNRGFAALGIPAAVSNLWSVDNESTYRITESFYKFLSQGLPTDVALQKAKLEFINNSPSKEKQLPYFWAGSILTGKVDIIKPNAGFPWKAFAVAAVLALCTGYFAVKFLFKKKNSTYAIHFTSKR